MNVFYVMICEHYRETVHQTLRTGAKREDYLDSETDVREDKIRYERGG